MKKIALFLVVALCASFALPAFAAASLDDSFDDLIAAPGLPQLPMIEALAGTANFFGGTCTVIRPVQNHSDCNYMLCESYGCGAPFKFDPIDCSCHCGYAF